MGGECSVTRPVGLSAHSDGPIALVFFADAGPRHLQVTNISTPAAAIVAIERR
jgi:hypothetical protein